MKMNSETAVSIATSLIGVAAMVFGMSKDEADEMSAMVPQVVGAVMTLVTAVSYVFNKRKSRETAANIMLTMRMGTDGKTARSADAAHEIVTKTGLL